MISDSNILFLVKTYHVREQTSTPHLPDGVLRRLGLLLSVYYRAIRNRNAHELMLWVSLKLMPQLHQCLHKRTRFKVTDEVLASPRFAWGPRNES